MTQTATPAAKPNAPASADIAMLRKTFDNSQSLQTEFGTWERYLSYYEAMRTGRAKLHRAGGIRGNA